MITRSDLITADLWLEHDLNDPSWDIAQAWRIVERIALHYPEAYTVFSRELSNPPLIFAMRASDAAQTICCAALLAKRSIDHV